VLDRLVGAEQCQWIFLRRHNQTPRDYGKAKQCKWSGMRKCVDPRRSRTRKHSPLTHAPAPLPRSKARGS
jgi:hypothetical protein